MVLGGGVLALSLAAQGRSPRYLRNNTARWVNPGRNVKLGDRLLELSLPVENVPEAFIRRVITATEPYLLREIPLLAATFSFLSYAIRFAEIEARPGYILSSAADGLAERVNRRVDLALTSQCRAQNVGD